MLESSFYDPYQNCLTSLRLNETKIFFSYTFHENEIDVLCRVGRKLSNKQIMIEVV